jgi:sugar phosphate isomerase/epimerase
MKTTYPLDQNLGVKSYSFRHIKENSDVAAAVRYCGGSTIDLSRCHVNYDDPAEQERTIETYRQAGIRITGIGVVTMTTDEKTNRQYFEFVRRAGCNLISFSFFPEDHEQILRNVEALCGEYDVRVAIHNHGGKHWLGNSTILKYFFGRTTPSVGLCLDTAWCLQAGEDPLQWLELFGERLYGVHFKDFVCNPSGKFRDTLLGEGMLNLPAFLEAFRGLPFDGSAVVEYEGTDPVEATAKCVAVVRQVWETGRGVGQSSGAPAQVG